MVTFTKHHGIKQRIDAVVTRTSRFIFCPAGALMRKSDRDDKVAFVKERIAYTRDAISTQMAMVYRLNSRNFDTSDAKERLKRLEVELREWEATHRAMAARS